MLIVGQHGASATMRTDIDLSYLADATMMFRFFEARARSARRSPPSRAARRRTSGRSASSGSATESGLQIGEPIAGFEGVLGDAAVRGITKMMGDLPRMNVGGSAPRSSNGCSFMRREAATRRSSRRCCTRRRCTRRYAPRSSCSTRRCRRGAGIAFVTEESFGGPALEALTDWVARQPPWSDFPFIVLVARRTGRRPGAASGVLARLGNVVLLERPLNAETLVSAARSALRARDRQYQTRRHLIEQEEARLAERIANAEASRANEALEVAVEAGELGTFHCPWPLRAIEWNAKCKEHFWLPADAEVDFDRFYSLVHDDDREQRARGDRRRDRRPRRLRRRVPDGLRRRQGALDPRQGPRLPRRRRASRSASTASRSTSAARSSSRSSARRCSRPSAQARVEAERASRMKDEFLATLSHELRTPLSAILGWTHLLGRRDAAAIDVAKAAATIERNARAQARLIEELLDVSRITSGNLHLDIQPVSIAAVFETVVSSLKPAADARSIRLRQDPDGAGEVLADASRLQQVVWNLLSNAIKFTPPGG